jgi:hypothetical protein
MPNHCSGNPLRSVANYRTAQLQIGRLSLCSVGLPMLRSPEFCPVSRWLQSIVLVLSEFPIDAASSKFDGHAIGTLFYLNELLSIARGRRCTAEEKLPALLRFQGRIRQANQHYMAPRFARKRCQGVMGKILITGIQAEHV